MFARSGPGAGRREESMQEVETQAYLIAVDRRRGLGVAVTIGDGYRLIAADPCFPAARWQPLPPSEATEQAAESMARVV